MNENLEARRRLVKLLRKGRKKQFSAITSSTDLSLILKNLYGRRYDTKVVGRDQLKEINQKRRQIIIMNLNTSKQPGSHWVLVLMSNPKYAIYYDSYGAQPPNEVKDYRHPERNGT